MANRYWVGITGTWNTSSTTVWSDAAPLSLATASCSGTTLTTTGSPALVVGMTVWSSTFVSLGTITGGSGNTWTVSTGGTYASQTMIAATTGASVPTAADNVFFTRPSTNYTVVLTGALTCNNFNKTGASTVFTGTGTLAVSGSFSLIDATSWSATGAFTFNATTTGNTIATNGTFLSASIDFIGAGGDWTLGSALSTSGSVTVTRGTFTTNNYAVTATSLSSNNSNTRTINLGSSTLTLNGAPITFTNSTGLTLNAGTSRITCSASSPTFNGGGNTFYDVSFTASNSLTTSINGANTFNNLTIAGRNVSQINAVSIQLDQVINGTLTLSAGSSAPARTFLFGFGGATRTLTVNNFAAGSADVDFQNIAIAGAAAPIYGTRFGDCKGNSGITFSAAKTVYWNNAASTNWSSTVWAATPGGTSSSVYFPLAQDTAVFTSTAPTSASTITVNANYNIGTIDMSARTSNTMTLTTGVTTPTIYGNWINGTGITLAGSGVITFGGRGTQTITSAGKAFPQPLTINSLGGSVVLQDALSLSGTSGIQFTCGTFDANGYNVTLPSFLTNGSLARTIAFGSGTWTISGAGSIWQANSTNLTTTGTGIVSLTSASAKTFAGGDIQTYPTLNQGGVGPMTITGSNKFANITNTAVGSVRFTGGTTNEFTNFNLNGTSTAARLTLGSTTTTQAILKKPSTWFMGSGSLDGGNNTGLVFVSGGGIDFLSVSYIDGQVAIPTVTYSGNFFAFF